MIFLPSLLHIQSIAAFYAEPSSHGEHVIEKGVMMINDISSLEKNSQFQNIRKVGDEVALRSSDGKGSLINLNEEISSDNWSAEFMVKNIILKDVEKIGMYLWYTDKKIEEGTYKGGSSVFNGFVVGIEFTQDKADIAFGFNYGLDFEGKEIQTMKYDHINPTLIENLDQFRVKIIHTEKNFKVELFDSHGSLLSDSFRIHEPLIMNKEDHKKNFAITTKYENIPADVYLNLRDLKISTREETSKYNHKDLHTEHNSFPRNKSEEEIRTAIADINHFLNYLTVVLGSADNNNIIQMAIEVKKKSRLIKDNLDSMISMARESLKLDTKAEQMESSAKIHVFEKSLNDVLQKVEKYKLRLKEIGKKKNTINIKISNVVLVLGMCFIMMAAVDTVIRKLIGQTKDNKRE